MGKGHLSYMMPREPEMVLTDCDKHIVLFINSNMSHIERSTYGVLSDRIKGRKLPATINHSVL